MPLHFLLPESASNWPRSIEDFWTWQTTTPQLTPWWGRYHWVLQTYLRLKDAGYPCELTHEMPNEGIVVSHRDCLPATLRPGPRVLMVSLLVDRAARHPFAQLHVVHRPGQMTTQPDAYYLPPWPQVSLLPRDPARGDRFETLAFVGYAHNLDRAFLSHSFTSTLASMGLRLEIPDPAQWHDFRNVDGVFAVRQLGRFDAGRKSAIKLINAWAAGVPAVLGYELGFRDVRRSVADYLEVTTVDEAATALERLADDAALRQRMVKNGYERAQAFSATALTEQWIRFFDEVAEPLWQRWCGDRQWRVSYRLDREADRLRGGLLRRIAMLG